MGYFEEKKLGKTYDARLLKRLFPFLKPYNWTILASIFLVMLITILDLAIPYVTKITIDQYIVPKIDSKVFNADRPDTSAAPSRYLKVEPKEPGIQTIIDRHVELFEKDGRFVVISYQHLSRLEPKEIAVLRKDDLAGVGRIGIVFLLIIILSFGPQFPAETHHGIHRFQNDERPAAVSL